MCTCQITVMSDSLQPYGLQPTRLLYPLGFSRQEYWSGSPHPPSGDLDNPGIKPASLMFPALAGGFFTTRGTWETHLYVHLYVYTLFILTCTFIFPHGLGFYYPGSECLGEGNGNPLQYSCLENSMDRGAWWATVRGVAKNQND